MKTRRKMYLGSMFVVALFAIMMTGMVGAQAAPQNAATGALSIDNLVVSPQPVYPGQNVTITFQLYDLYPYTLTNVNLGLQGTYPLLNYSPSNTQLISSIGAGLYGGSANYLTYHVHIPSYVQAGSYTLYLVATYETTTSVTVGGSLTTENIASESEIPITMYVEGKPNIVLNANPVTQVIPGESSQVDLTAVNTGTGDATNLSVTALSTNKFSVIGTDNFNLGVIAPGGESTGVFTLQANNTLSGGIESIPVRIKYTLTSGLNVSQNESVPISILVSNPNIVVSISSAEPQFLYSGGNQSLALSIQNIGTGVAKNLTVNFYSNPQISVGSSSSQFFLGSLGAGASSSETLFITANKNDNSTTYYLPASIRYRNANYQQGYNKTQNLQINLQKSAIFDVVNVTSNLYPGVTFVPVTFRITNTGSQEADQVSLSLQTIYPVTPVNSNAYIAKLAPGQSENVTFYVNVDSGGSAGSYPVTLFEQWTQPNGATNQQYTSSQNYFAPVAAASTSQNTSAYYYIAIVVVVIVVFVAYTRNKKAKADIVSGQEKKDAKTLSKK